MLHLAPLSKTLVLLLCGLPIVHAAEMSEKVPLELTQPAYASPWKRYDKWKQTDWKQYSNLAHQIASSISPPQKLKTPIQGDPKHGRQLVIDRKQGGGCVACHILPEASLPGNVGPDLSMIGIWGRSDEELFNRIDDPRRFNSVTVMPPWGAHDIFTPKDIKDIVAYLKTLKTPVEFNAVQDNPAQRQVPAQNRDNLDPLENPALFLLETGKSLWAQQGPLEYACHSCHQQDLEARFTTWAVTMPKFEPRLNKMIGIEEFITRHARATTGAEYVLQSDDNLALAIFLRYLANGQAIAVDHSDPKTQAAFERGEALVKRKIGQLNLSCIDCHGISANKWLRGQYLTSFLGMYDHFPTYRTSRGEVWDIRKRFQWCGVAIRANELPPDAAEYGDLELYLAVLNKGRKLDVPGIRH